MWCNQIFSLMSCSENIYTVENIIVCDNYETASQLARETCGVDAIAEDTTLYPLNIGDTYSDGKFWRDGVEIQRNPTEAEEIVLLKREISVLLGEE